MGKNQDCVIIVNEPISAGSLVNRQNIVGPVLSPQSDISAAKQFQNDIIQLQVQLTKLRFHKDKDFSCQFAEKWGNQLLRVKVFGKWFGFKLLVSTFKISAKNWLFKVLAMPAAAYITAQLHLYCCTEGHSNSPKILVRFSRNEFNNNASKRYKLLDKTIKLYWQNSRKSS